MSTKVDRVAERVIFGGRYAVYDEVASGGMAAVFLAAPLGPPSGIPPVVALKKLAAEFAKQPEFIAMFLDEAHLAEHVRHRNVVTTYEFLRTRDGLGIVMDLVVGEAFVRLLRREPGAVIDRPPIPVAVAVVLGALEGLHCAHEATDDAGRPLHLVHRDLSPHNILVGADGVARVIDFGVAKAVGRLQTSDLGVLKGKFAYMAPEQIRGAAVDRRADVYAAGIVLWEALTGTNLFRASPNQALLDQRSSGQAPIVPPSLSQDSVSPQLDAIVMRALEFDPARRFETAQAMADVMRERLEVADDATVATWVRSRVGTKLDALEAKRRKIGESVTRSQATSSRFVVSSSTLVDPRGPTIPSVVDVPEGGDTTAPSGADQKDTRLVGAQRPRPVPPTPRAPSQGKFGGDIVLDGPASPDARGPAGGLELEPGIATTLRSSPPAVEAERPPRARRPAPSRALRREPRPHRGVLVVAVLLLLLGFVGGLVVRGPAQIKARVLAAATEHGVALSLERVELTRAGLTLRGVKASLVGCPGVNLTAAQADITLDRGFGVDQVSLPDYELTVSGGTSEVAAALAAWRGAGHRPLAVEARAGHVVWSSAAIPTLVLEALDVSASLASSPGQPMTLDSSSLLVNLPRGHAGPWRAHVELSTSATRVRIGLDAANADAPPSATYIERPVEGATWTLDIPRGSTFKIGVPADLFGLASDLSLDVSLHARVGASGASLEGEGHVGIYGLQVATGRGAKVPLDLVVSGRVAGDPTRPIPLDGATLALGKASSAVTGSLSLKPDGVRVEIDRTSTRGEAMPALALDTREWTGAPANSGK